MRIPLNQYWSLLAAYLRPQQLSAGLLGLLMLVTIGLELVNPQIVRSFIDTALAGGELTQLAGAATLFIDIAIAQQATSVAARYVGERVGWSATNALRRDIAAHCLKLDMDFHKARTPGEIIERVDGDVTALARFFSQFVVQVLGNCLLLLGALALLFREDWRVGLVMAVFVVLAIVVLSWIQSRAVPRWSAVRQASAEFFGFLGETLGATEDVRANGAVGYVMHRFQLLIHHWFPVERRAGLASYAMWQSSLILFTIGTAAAFGLGGWLYLTGQITLGSVYLIFSYTELLRRPIEQIRSELQDLQQAGAGMLRLRELLAIQPTIHSGSQTLPSGPLDIRVERMTFAYEDEASGHGNTDKERAANKGTKEQRNKRIFNSVHSPQKDSRQTRRKPRRLASGHSSFVFRLSSKNGQPSSIVHRPSSHVLRDITFALPAGKVLGLLGRTGSGKTTLARMLVRLYDPGEGSICLGGADLRDIALASLRSRVAMVTQDVQLFQASLRDNLTLFDPGVADTRLVDVLEDIGLGPWLTGLPEGLDTILSGTAGLSAGESQLLALARVFLRDPGLIIMDEASSRLDPATERLLERAIGQLLQERTAVIIAHRLATVQRADELIILEDGQIVEQGGRAALAADPGSRFTAALRIGLDEVLA
jgi:ABC-type multidrug transport system fused ATPase/permease subunit